MHVQGVKVSPVASFDRPELNEPDCLHDSRLMRNLGRPSWQKGERYERSLATRDRNFRTRNSPGKLEAPFDPASVLVGSYSPQRGLGLSRSV